MLLPLIGVEETRAAARVRAPLRRCRSCQTGVTAILVGRTRRIPRASIRGRSGSKTRSDPGTRARVPISRSTNACETTILAQTEAFVVGFKIPISQRTARVAERRLDPSQNTRQGIVNRGRVLRSISDR